MLSRPDAPQELQDCLNQGLLLAKLQIQMLAVEPKNK